MPAVQVDPGHNPLFAIALLYYSVFGYLALYHPHPTLVHFSSSGRTKVAELNQRTPYFWMDTSAAINHEAVPMLFQLLIMMTPTVRLLYQLLLIMMTPRYQCFSSYASVNSSLALSFTWPLYDSVFGLLLPGLGLLVAVGRVRILAFVVLWPPILKVGIASISSPRLALLMITSPIPLGHYLLLAVPLITSYTTLLSAGDERALNQSLHQH